MSKGLTPKQQRFVEEYLIDLNGTQAAIRAGYAESGASVEGSRLLANAKIQTAVAAAKAKRSEETGITAEYVLNGLKAEAEEKGDGASHGARVNALSLLGKHLGIFERDNTQKAPIINLSREETDI